MRLTEKSHVAHLPVIEQGQHGAGGMDFQEDVLMSHTVENMQSKHTGTSLRHREFCLGCFKRAQLRRITELRAIKPISSDFSSHQRFKGQS